METAVYICSKVPDPHRTHNIQRLDLSMLALIASSIRDHAR